MGALQDWWKKSTQSVRCEHLLLSKKDVLIRALKWFKDRHGRCDNVTNFIVTKNKTIKLEESLFSTNLKTNLSVTAATEALNLS